MLNLPTDLTTRYRYKYNASCTYGIWRHSYEIVGQHGGAQLHVSGPYNYDGHDHWSAGLELHSRTPLGGEERPPSHDRCWLLEAPCWHNGTSMYAQGHFLPMVMRDDYRGVFRDMINWADENLKRDTP